jgi:hypothetical protein
MAPTTSPGFEGLFKSPDCYNTIDPADSQKTKRNVKNCLPSYLFSGQILLNLPVDDSQFGYITKLKRKKPVLQNY